MACRVQLRVSFGATSTSEKNRWSFESIHRNDVLFLSVPLTTNTGL